MNRNRLIPAVAAGVLLLTVTIIGMARLRNGPPEASKRTLVAELGYCGAEGPRPCIESFLQDADGYLQVHVLVPNRKYPEFFLTINRAGDLQRYLCQKDDEVPVKRTCLGRNMPLGELLEFSLIAFADEQVLANGQFAIIGLLLNTPSVETAEVPAMTEVVVLETDPPLVLDFPTPFGPPGSTATDPSYPNPGTSYPDPGTAYP